MLDFSLLLGLRILLYISGKCRGKLENYWTTARRVAANLGD
jgi:hypothetical protein